MPFISVIIPVYQMGKKIKKCIDSLIQQQTTDIELIFILDGPDEECEAVLIEYQQSYQHIILYTQENQGAMASRKKGMQLAQGTYVLFVDADDALEPNCMVECIPLLRQYEFDVLRFGSIDENQDGAFQVSAVIDEPLAIYEEQEVQPFMLQRMLSGYTFNTMWGEFIKRSLLSDLVFETQLIVAEDLNFNYELSYKVRKLGLVQACYYRYAYNTEGIMRRIDPSRLTIYIANMMNVYEKIYHALPVVTKEQCLFLYKEMLFYFYKCNSCMSKHERAQYMQSMTAHAFYQEIKGRLTINDIKNYPNGFHSVMAYSYQEEWKRGLWMNRIIEMVSQWIHKKGS